MAGLLATVAQVQGLGARLAALEAGGGGGGGGSGGYPPLLSSFGTIDGDGSTTTNNDATFTAAEANAEQAFVIPSGKILKTTRLRSQLTKGYEGRGHILAEGGYLPAKFSYAAVAPSPSGTGIANWFRGDQKFTDGGEYKVIGPNVREYNLSQIYYDSTLIPHHAWFDIHSGNSGWYAGILSAAGTTINVTGVETGIMGKQIGLSANGMDGVITETKTVVNVDTVNKSITVDSPITGSYPYNPSAGIFPCVMTGHRSWNGFSYLKVLHNGGGDGYGSIVRISISYQKKPGATHFFQTATGGQYGGSVDFLAGSSGAYATGWESQYNDGGNDVAVIGQVDSFVRTNDTGALATTWLGTLFKSEGSKPADVAHVITGKWRVGIDTVRADLSTWNSTGDGINAAISTAKGQRWVMNSTVSASGRSGHPQWATMWGNVPGDMYIESGNDGGGAISSDYIALRFARAAGSDGRLRIRPTVIQMNTVLQVAQSLGVGTDIFLGASNILAFGAGSGGYFQKIGAYIYWAVNGTLQRVMLIGTDA